MPEIETETPQRAGQADAPDAGGSPGRLPIELIFWGMVLVAAGYFCYWPLRPYGIVSAPHAVFGRLIVLLGVVVLCHRTRGSAFGSDVVRAALVIAAASAAWIFALVLSRVAALQMTNVATLVTRCNGVIDLSDNAMLLALLWLCRRRGAIASRKWLIGTFLFGLAALAVFVGDVFLPRSWAFVRDEWKASKWLSVLYVIQFAYSIAIVYFVFSVRKLRRPPAPR